jgi:hypothetical protein
VRTTVDIPAELLEHARRAVNARTNREAILAGLEELIRKAKREALRALPGRLDLELDLPRARGRAKRA